MTVDESIASMKASLLKKIKRSAYVYRVDCGCNGCEIEIFATLSPLFDANASALKSFRHRVMRIFLLFTGAVTRAMRSPALRACSPRRTRKSCISYGPAVTRRIFHDLYCVWAVRIKSFQWMFISAARQRLPPRCTALRWRSACWAENSRPWAG